MLLLKTIKSVVPRWKGKEALLNQTVRLGQVLQCLTLTKTFAECLSSGHPTGHVWGGSEWDQNSDPAGHGLLGPERGTQFHAHAHRGQAEICRIHFGFDSYVSDRKYVCPMLCEMLHQLYNKWTGYFQPCSRVWVTYVTRRVLIRVFPFQRETGRCRGSSFSHGECSRIRTQCVSQRIIGNVESVFGLCDGDSCCFVVFYQTTCLTRIHINRKLSVVCTVRMEPSFFLPLKVNFSFWCLFCTYYFLH